MLEKTNKILIILVSVLIVLLIISVILFSMVIKVNNKKDVEPQSAIIADNLNLNNIETKTKQNPIEITDSDVIVAIPTQIQEINSNETTAISAENYGINNVVANTYAPYYIKVNVQENTLTIYKKDANGKYNLPLKSMECSCGDATPVEGTYSLKKYNNWNWKTLYKGGYAQYASQVSGDILISSVAYTEKGNNASLNFNEYDKLGSKTTYGGVSLTVENAKWIYDNCIPGTQVTFYKSPEPSPLGKPIAKKITEDEQVRGWDPTDPAENNPWRTYVRPEKKEEKKQEQSFQNIFIDGIITNNQSTINAVNTNTTQNNNVQANQNTVANNTTNNNTTSNNTVSENTVNNTQTNTTPTVENKVLEKNNDVTITSEVIDYNSL